MAITIEDGTPNGGNSWISVADFDLWLTDTGNSVTYDPAQKEIKLKEAFRLLSTFTFCDPHNIAYTVKQDFKDAQCELVVAFSNGFDIRAETSDNVLVKKGLGRSAIVKEWKVGKDSFKTDLLTLFKRKAPMSDAILKNYLCDDSSSSINFELVR